MKNYILNLCILLSANAWAAPVSVQSPDGRLRVDTDILNGQPIYSVSYDGNSFIENSPLGLKSDIGDFSSDMTLEGSETGVDTLIIMPTDSSQHSRTKTERL